MTARCAEGSAAVLWECVCGCRGIAAGLDVCPMCGKEKPMPKATSGGASNQWEQQEPSGAAEATQVLAETLYEPEQVAAAVGLPVSESGGATPVPADGSAAVGAVENAPADGEPSGAPVKQRAGTDYASMTQAALRDEAKSRGLPVSGSKADLAAKLTEHDTANPAAPAQATPKQPPSVP